MIVPCEITNDRVAARRIDGCVAVVHRLKCWTNFYDEIVAGRKRHDLRRAHDRNFRVGDRILLCEFDPNLGIYTGREQLVEISYITSAEQPCALSDLALHRDFCILSIVLVTQD